jgi:general secretion pathway protein K
MALLMAMLVVVIATTISVNIAHDGKFTIRKTAHIQTMDRADLYALGLEDYSRIVLREDSEESNIDSLEESWAIGVPGLPIEGGYLTGYLEDEQAKFNLNTLLGSDLAVKRFRRLCDNLGVDDIFIPALLDWIDTDFDVRYPDGAEENYDNYRVANRRMYDISELLLVQNVTPEMFDLLRPHITALEPTSLMNVNTMSEVIFQSLGDNLDVSRFIEEREDTAYNDIQDFVTRVQVSIKTDGLSVSSKNFRAHGQVVQGDIIFNLTSLMYRDKTGKTTVMNRTLGQF